jgi:SNF2 family DNA or RNA helicase
MKKARKKAKFAYLWVTLALFLISIVGHWVAGWYEFVEEQSQHGEIAEARPFVIKMTRSTLENWQSEFLQLIWQVAGLAFLWHVGSPQSKEGDDRKEAKIDEVLKRVAGPEADEIMRRLEQEYPKK